MTITKKIIERIKEILNYEHYLIMGLFKDNKLEMLKLKFDHNDFVFFVPIMKSSLEYELNEFDIDTIKTAEIIIIKIFSSYNNPWSGLFHYIEMEVITEVINKEGMNLENPRINFLNQALKLTPTRITLMSKNQLLEPTRHKHKSIGPFIYNLKQDDSKNFYLDKTNYFR